jgi:hypothetical protein
MSQLRKNRKGVTKTPPLPHPMLSSLGVHFMAVKKVTSEEGQKRSTRSLVLGPGAHSLS